MCIPAPFLRPEVTTKPQVLGAHSVASHKLLQPRLLCRFQFNKHVPSGAVTGGRVGTQDVCDPALRTALGEPDDKKIRSLEEGLALPFTETVWFPDLPICEVIALTAVFLCTRNVASGVRTGKTPELRPSRAPCVLGSFLA